MRDVTPDWDALIHDCFLYPENEERLTRLFQALSPYLRAILVSTYSHDFSTVEDALQTAFIKFMGIFRKRQTSTLHLGYFVVIAKNCLIDELRRRKGHVALDEVAESELPSVSTPETSQREARMLLLQRALLQMDARCRFVLESYYINEVDAFKLATWLGISADSVHMAIKRCRDRLRAMLAPTAASARNATTGSETAQN